MTERSDCHVAFVRNVMIGREGLDRAVLLDLFAAAGARNAVSYIATGNVSFEGPANRVPGIIDAVSTGVADLLGRPTPLFVRTLPELRSLVDRDPFDNPAFADVRNREVAFFLARAPEVDLPIRSPRGDIEVFARSDRELFSVSRERGGGTGSPGGMIERITGERVTMRAWSTITRIVAKLG